MLMLQDKLNTYIWYIDSKQYQSTYPKKQFKQFLIKIFFIFAPSGLCEQFIAHVNNRLSSSNIMVEYVVDKGNND